MTQEKPVELTPRHSPFQANSQTFPFWLVIMGALVGWMIFAVISNDAYNEAFTEIIPGLRSTLILTVGAFISSLFLGLVIGLGRISKNPAISTISQLYIEFVRGVPMIVFIFFIALVMTPDAVDLWNWIFRSDVSTRTVSNMWRGWAALSLFYAAFIAEVVRAGVQSVEKGQIEAGTALGLSKRQVMVKITLPQAIRNTFPALGNDLIALMKDTSLVSVIAAAELTYEARIYQGSSFRIRETFFILMVIYVVLTLTLSLILRFFEKRMEIPGRQE